MRAYILTESDLKLLEVKWDEAKQKIWAKHGPPFEDGKAKDSAANDAVRILNYTLHDWLIDVARK